MADAPAFTQLTDVASSAFGGRVLFATDEWFAIAQNLLSPAEPLWDEHKFTEYGKWMDGWETRRKRIAGHDWCIVRLAVPCEIRGIEVDTAHFTGNFTPRASVQAAHLSDDPGFQHAALGQMGTCATADEVAHAETLGTGAWEEIVPRSALGAGVSATRRSYFKVEGQAGGSVYTHLRLNMFPDGGIARLRVYGTPVASYSRSSVVDLLSALHGARALGCSNQHYGHPRNLILPGRGATMGEGWETARHPDRPSVLAAGPDGMLQGLKSDSAVLQLCGDGGFVSELVVDTHHFKGNFPESCLVEACVQPAAAAQDGAAAAIEPAADAASYRALERTFEGAWRVLLPRAKLSASREHAFSLARGELHDVGRVAFVRVTMYPDGGIMRLRAFGTADAPSGASGSGAGSKRKRDS